MDVNVGSALRVPGGNPVDGLSPARHVYRQVKLEEQYWCVGKPRPKGTATFWNFDFFEHVSRR